MATMNELQSVRCPRCKRGPGKICILDSGRVASSFHNERSQFAESVKKILPAGVRLKYRGFWRA